VLSRLINESNLNTRLKVISARIPYFFVTLFYGKKPRIATKGGIKYELDFSEGIDLSLFIFGRYQEHVTHNKLIPIPKDAVIIDVGANMGAMSLQFAKIASSGKVYSFEPTHYSMARLKRNISLNPELSARIEVINSFVSSKSTENAKITAFASWKVDGGQDENAHPVHLGTAKDTDGVGSVSLDDFCKARNLNKIDLVKIDTDGHEYDVFLGAKEALKKYRPYIIFEAGLYSFAEKNIDFSFYINYFKELNYKMYDSLKKAEITADNFRKYIPEKRTIDVIAVPQKVS
jgi:FkbM family methyltransferase